MAATTGTWVWHAGWNSLTFLRGPHGEFVTPEHRHPQADPGPFATWEGAQASMLTILGVWLAALDTDPDGEAYHPSTRGQVAALASDLARHVPGTEWRNKCAQGCAFWIEAEARCACGHNADYHRGGAGDCAARPDPADPTTCACLRYTA